jgi:hypothetical protein
MKNITYLFVFLCLVSSVQAQEFVPIVPGGDYACITFPDGSVKLGKANPDGYSLITEAKAKAALNRRLELIKGKTDRLKELKQELNKTESLFSEKKMEQGLKAYKSVFKKDGGGFDSIPVTETKEDQLNFIDALISNLQTEKSSVKFQVSEIKDCDVKEPFVPAGSIKVEIVNAVNGVAAVLYAKEGFKYFTGVPFCVRGADGVIQGLAFQVSPCALMDCSKKGYIGISLYNVSADHAISVDERASFLAQVQEHASGAYEVKVIKVKNNVQLTCEQTLD